MRHGGAVCLLRKTVCACHGKDLYGSELFLSSHSYNKNGFDFSHHRRQKWLLFVCFGDAPPTLFPASMPKPHPKQNLKIKKPSSYLFEGLKQKLITLFYQSKHDNVERYIYPIPLISKRNMHVGANPIESHLQYHRSRQI